MKLYNDDCINVMQQMINDGVKVDLTVTSPPYDNLRSYENEVLWDFGKFKEVAILWIWIGIFPNNASCFECILLVVSIICVIFVKDKCKHIDARK